MLSHTPQLWTRAHVWFQASLESCPCQYFDLHNGTKCMRLKNFGRHEGVQNCLPSLPKSTSHAIPLPSLLHRLHLFNSAILTWYNRCNVNETAGSKRVGTFCDWFHLPYIFQSIQHLCYIQVEAPPQFCKHSILLSAITPCVLLTVLLKLLQVGLGHTA